MENFGKKAEISSSMLVTTFLLIAAFLIVLVVYSTISWENLSDNQVCHQSVVLRGTLPETLGVNNFVPLQCKTEKICVRGSSLFDKGDCEDDFGDVNDKIIYSDVQIQEDVEKVIAENIADCYSMMGEGEISLFSEDWGTHFGWPSSVRSSCVICSRVAFDEKTLMEKGIDVSKRDVLNYMMTHKVPNKNISYYEYLTEGKTKISDSISIENLRIEDPETGETIEEPLSNLVQNVEDDGNEEIAILFMQVAAPSGSQIFKNNLVAAGVTGLGFSSVVGVGTTSKYAVKGITTCAKNPWCAGVAIVLAGAQQVSGQYNRGIVATKCGDVSVGEEARDGCSVVRTVNYNLEDISQYCNVIESIS